MLHISAIKEIKVTNNLSITSPRPSLPHGLLGFFLMFYFSKINNSKFHFHLLVNQKGLHLEYIKYISHGTPWLKKIPENLHIPSYISIVVWFVILSRCKKMILKIILQPWSIKSLHCNFLVLIKQLMWSLFVKIRNIFIHPKLLEPTDPSLHNQWID
jgi:hypothetical protein